jgi:hypothetical protein
MYKRLLVACALLVVSAFMAMAQEPAVAPAWGYEDTYQINVLQNLTTADAVINLTNGGFYTPLGSIFPNTGYLCANIYVFGGVAPADPSGEQLAACCTCPISRNGVRSVRGRQLVSNPLTNVTLNAAAIKIVWTTPPGGVTSPGSCNPAGLPTTNVLAALNAAGQPVNNGGFATGGRAWATHWHVIAPTPAFGTETRFEEIPLTAAERNVLNENCAFIIGNGSGAGICAGCPTGGAQGAAGNRL